MEQLRRGGGKREGHCVSPYLSCAAAATPTLLQSRRLQRHWSSRGIVVSHLGSKLSTHISLCIYTEFEKSL